MRVAVENGGLDELEAITRAIESAGGLEYTARLAQREKDLASRPWAGYPSRHTDRRFRRSRSSRSVVRTDPGAGKFGDGM